MLSKILMAVCLSLLLGQLSAQEPLLLVNSSQTHNAFQFTLSLQQDETFSLFSRRLLKTPHWTQVDTHGPEATFSPALRPDSVLLNIRHDGRLWLEFYEHAKPTPKTHFHYIEVERREEVTGYLLPAFAHKVPGFRVDSLYRCSNALVSVTWADGDAHIVVFSEKDQWRIAQNVDTGFRGGEHDVFYGYVADFDHSSPIVVEIGEQDYCTITGETARAKSNLNWRDSDSFSLDDILYSVGDSLPIEKRKRRFASEEL